MRSAKPPTPTTPTLVLNQILYFNKITRSFVCMSKFEKHRPTGLCQIAIAEFQLGFNLCNTFQEMEPVTKKKYTWKCVPMKWPHWKSLLSHTVIGYSFSVLHILKRKRNWCVVWVTFDSSPLSKPAKQGRVILRFVTARTETCSLRRLNLRGQNSCHSPKMVLRPPCLLSYMTCYFHNFSKHWLS